MTALRIVGLGFGIIIMTLVTAWLVSERMAQTNRRPIPAWLWGLMSVTTISDSIYIIGVIIPCLKQLN